MAAFLPVFPIPLFAAYARRLGDGLRRRKRGVQQRQYGHWLVLHGLQHQQHGHWPVLRGFGGLGYYANTSFRTGSFVFADRSIEDAGNAMSDESCRAPNNHSATWRVTGGFRVVTGGGSGYVPTRGVSLLPSGSTNGAPNWNQTTALAATSTGAYLSDAGVWTSVSDQAKKFLFEPIAGEDVLRQVPITRWSYKAEPSAVRHLGPVAQDFRRTFGLGPASVSIGTVDTDGPLGWGALLLAGAGPPGWGGAAGPSRAPCRAPNAKPPPGAAGRRFGVVTSGG